MNPVKKMDKDLLDIIMGYKEDGNQYKAITEIKNVFRGLRLDGDNIELQCYSCGRKIHPFIDEVSKLHFDPGESDCRDYPGEPAQIFLVCEDCMEKGAGR